MEDGFLGRRQFPIDQIISEKRPIVPGGIPIFKHPEEKKCKAQKYNSVGIGR